MIATRPPPVAVPDPSALAREAARVSSLRLLMFNIQFGLETSHYAHYLTRSWRHAAPSREISPEGRPSSGY